MLVGYYGSKNDLIQVDFTPPPFLLHEAWKVGFTVHYYRRFPGYLDFHVHSFHRSLFIRRYPVSLDTADLIEEPVVFESLDCIKDETVDDLCIENEFLG